MALERTLSIIKPDAVAQNAIGAILGRFEAAGLRIIAARMKVLTQIEAESFYSEHIGKPFYEPLVRFMTSGPCLVSVLEGDNAVAAHRALLGATNPRDAAAGTIRADFGTGAPQNAAHGSDSVDNAQKEIAFFFRDSELCPRP